MAYFGFLGTIFVDRVRIGFPPPLHGVEASIYLPSSVLFYLDMILKCPVTDDDNNEIRNDYFSKASSKDASVIFDCNIQGQASMRLFEMPIASANNDKIWCGKYVCVSIYIETPKLIHLSFALFQTPRKRHCYAWTAHELARALKISCIAFWFLQRGQCLNDPCRFESGRIRNDDINGVFPRHESRPAYTISISFLQAQLSRIREAHPSTQPFVRSTCPRRV